MLTRDLVYDIDHVIETFDLERLSTMLEPIAGLREGSIPDAAKEYFATWVTNSLFALHRFQSADSVLLLHTLRLRVLTDMSAFWPMAIGFYNSSEWSQVASGPHGAYFISLRDDAKALLRTREILTGTRLHAFEVENEDETVTLRLRDLDGHGVEAHRVAEVISAVVSLANAFDPSEGSAPPRIQFIESGSDTQISIRLEAKLSDVIDLVKFMLVYLTTMPQRRHAAKLAAILDESDAIARINARVDAGQISAADGARFRSEVRKCATVLARNGAVADSNRGGLRGYESHDEREPRRLLQGDTRRLSLPAAEEPSE